MTHKLTPTEAVLSLNNDCMSNRIFELKYDLLTLMFKEFVKSEFYLKMSDERKDSIFDQYLDLSELLEGFSQYSEREQPEIGRIG